jgi:hypothetical protein
MKASCLLLADALPVSYFVNAVVILKHLTTLYAPGLFAMFFAHSFFYFQSTSVGW